MSSEPTHVGHNLDACTDCVMLLANGETPTDLTEEESAAYVAGIEKSWPGETWHLGLGSVDCEDCSYPADGEDREDCEPWFSWRACEVCGSTLGGDRSHAFADPRTIEAAGLRSVGHALATLDRYANQYKRLELAYGKLEEAHDDWRFELDYARRYYAEGDTGELLRDLLRETIEADIAEPEAPMALATPAEAAAYMAKGKV